MADIEASANAKDACMRSVQGKDSARFEVGMNPHPADRERPHRRLLDLFCGRWGWSRAFAARGWECVGVDLIWPDEIPDGCRFIRANVMALLCENKKFIHVYPLEESEPKGMVYAFRPDFIIASSPCEQFSVHGMKNFHPNPPYPELGIKLFAHARLLCEAAGIPYVLENVRAAQQFVGNAVNHCGPFYLWGNSVPPIMPQGILKGRRLMTGGYKGQTTGKSDKAAAAIIATIPPELANCVADYAERILEQRKTA